MTTPKSQYLIHIPDTIIQMIIKQLKLHNPPSLEEIETIVRWCVAGALSGSIFDDTTSEERTTRKALKRLKWELGEYMKELKSEGM